MTAFLVSVKNKNNQSNTIYQNIITHHSTFPSRKWIQHPPSINWMKSINSTIRNVFISNQFFTTFQNTICSEDNYFSSSPDLCNPSPHQYTLISFTMMTIILGSKATLLMWFFVGSINRCGNSSGSVLKWNAELFVIIDILFQMCQGHHWIGKCPSTLPLNKIIQIDSHGHWNSMINAYIIIYCIHCILFKTVNCDDKKQQTICYLSQNFSSSHFCKYIFISICLRKGLLWVELCPLPNLVWYFKYLAKFAFLAFEILTAN